MAHRGPARATLGPVPGEVAAETQPFPTRPAPFDLQGITVDDLIDFTPELRAEAEEILSRTSSTERCSRPRRSRVGRRRDPGHDPDAGMGGRRELGRRGRSTPRRALLYVPSVTSPSVTALVPPPGPGQLGPCATSRGSAPGSPDAAGGLPLLKPPYGRITAIDMNTGEHVWMSANGPGPTDHPGHRRTSILPWLGQRGRPAPRLTHAQPPLHRARGPKTPCPYFRSRAARPSGRGTRRPAPWCGRRCWTPAPRARR